MKNQLIAKTNVEINAPVSKIWKIITKAASLFIKLQSRRIFVYESEITLSSILET